MSRIKKSSRKRLLLIFFAGIILGVVVVLYGNRVMYHTGTNDYCASCHVHPHAIDSWKRSTHVNNASGVTVNCIDCHLPPKDGTPAHFIAKARLGLKDLWSYWFKDHEKSTGKGKNSWTMPSISYSTSRAKPVIPTFSQEVCQMTAEQRTSITRQTRQNSICNVSVAI